MDQGFISCGKCKTTKTWHIYILLNKHAKQLSKNDKRLQLKGSQLKIDCRLTEMTISHSRFNKSNKNKNTDCTNILTSHLYWASTYYSGCVAASTLNPKCWQFILLLSSLFTTKLNSQKSHLPLHNLEDIKVPALPSAAAISALFFFILSLIINNLLCLLQEFQNNC